MAAIVNIDKEIKRILDTIPGVNDLPGDQYYRIYMDLSILCYACIGEYMNKFNEQKPIT